MAALTIELPDSLLQQIYARNIPPHRLENAIAQFVELYLEESEATLQAIESAWTDPAEFARRVIANNRELFEELARLP